MAIVVSMRGTDVDTALDDIPSTASAEDVSVHPT